MTIKALDVGRPAVGQLVQVRGQHWVVTDVEPTALPPDIAAANPGEGETLVSLSCVEDDGAGVELRALWELELGVRVLEQATLPDLARGRFDDPAALGAFLDALRWGALTNAETTVLQAPFRAGIAVEDYQLEPVIRAVSMPRANLLIADDVGLGKTIEAGLVVQELLLRHRARRVMVVCPAPLREKWRDEMADRFGLHFVVVDSGEVRVVRRARGLHANPFRVHPFTVVSLSWLREAKCQRLLTEAFGTGERFPRPLDVLIVDEAHHCAPAGQGRYAVDSQQTRAVARLARQAEHRLFLSATPHNGYAESWTALLEMLDPQRFARGVTPDPVALKQVLIRRLKTTVVNPDGTPRYPQRQVHELEVNYAADDLAAHQLLAQYTQARARRLAAGRPGVRKASDLSTLLLKKRLFSSPAAFTHTLQVHARGLGEPQGDLAVSDVDVEWVSGHHGDLLQGDWGDDTSLAEAEAEVHTVAAQAGGEPSPLERHLVARLLEWAKEHGQDSDAKARALIAWLRQVCLRPEGTWTEERVVVFTEYRDTQRWLADLLERYHLGDQHLALLYGGMDDSAREEIKDQFQKPPQLHPVRILLATDTASEGIDLQLQCHRLVNYDIPFNPNRLEQRAGRIDRYGQRKSPEIYHFVGAHWAKAAAGSHDADLEFLTRIALKVSVMREDLGSVNPILAAQIERHMLGRPDPAFDLDQLQPPSAARAVLKAERQLRDEAARLRATLDRSARELHSTPADIERVVSVGLALDHQPPLKRGTDTVTGAPVYTVGALTGSWARTTDGLRDPDYGWRPISFDTAIAATRQDLVLAHLNHPLVAMATRLLRAEVWGHGRLARAASLLVDDPAVTDEILAAYSRLVLLGTDGARLHEEVFPAGGLLRGASFSRLGVSDVRRFLDAALGPDATPTASPSGVQERLAAMWPKVQDNVHAAVDARAGEREQSLRKALHRRRDEELTRVKALFEHFHASVRTAVREADHGRQLSFADLDLDERHQLEQDTDALRQRLATLPQEMQTELDVIAARYQQVTVRWFPAAVVHLVPARLARTRR